MSTTNKFVGENGWPRPLSARERHALNRTGGPVSRVPDTRPSHPDVEMQRCAHCGVTKPGRFTWLRNATADGWSQNRGHCHWACYACLPYGQGRDED